MIKRVPIDLAQNVAHEVGLEIGCHRVHLQILVEQQIGHTLEQSIVLFGVEQGIIDFEDELLLVPAFGECDETQDGERFLTEGQRIEALVGSIEFL